MKLSRSQRVEARIPTASMADIAFLLIIFFMVTTVHDVDRTSVALPSSQMRDETPKGASYVVIHREPVTNDIIYKFSDGEEQSVEVGGPSDLYLEASRIIHQDSTKPFIIKADGDLRYALVDEVLDNLRKAGVETLVLLTTQAKVDEGGAP